MDHEFDLQDDADDQVDGDEGAAPAQVVARHPLGQYGKLGGRPTVPTSVQEIGSRKVLYGSILAHWNKRRRLESQMQELDLTDRASLCKRRTDHLFVQTIKILANEAMLHDDAETRVKIYSKILDAVSKVDAAIAETHANMIRIALASSRHGGPQRSDDIPQSPEAVAEVLRESGLQEDEIVRQMGDSYPGAPS